MASSEVKVEIKASAFEAIYSLRRGPHPQLRALADRSNFLKEAALWNGNRVPGDASLPVFARGREATDA